MPRGVYPRRRLETAQRKVLRKVTLRKYHKEPKRQPCRQRYQLLRYDPTLTTEQIAYWIERKRTGKCEACGSGERLQWDHNHTTHRMRGILCGGCNFSLGALAENVDTLGALSKYINTHRPPPRLVVIVWLDTQDNEQTWADENEIDAFTARPCEITSIGYVVRETASHYVLAGDHHPGNGDYGRITKIPKGMVSTVQEIVR